MTMFFSSPFLILVLVCFEGSCLSLLLLSTVIIVLIIVTMEAPAGPFSLSNFLIQALRYIVFLFFITNSLLLFFITFEISMLPVRLLILFFGYQPEKLNAVVFLMGYTVVCSLPLFYFCLSCSSLLGISLSCIGHFSGLLLTSAFIAKLPMYSLHLWLPKAHVEASLAGSILLAGVILKLGGYGILVFSPSLVSIPRLYVFFTLSGCLVCSVICFRSWDMKSLVAYSSIVHIGVVTLGALSQSQLGYWSACGIIIGHSLVSPLMFVSANVLYLSTGTRSFVTGASSCIPTSFFFFVSILCGLNSGLPPFFNFWVEVAYFYNTLSLFSFSLIPLFLTAFFSFLYSILFYVRSCSGPPSLFLAFNFNVWTPVLSVVLLFLLPLSSSFVGHN